MPRQERFGHGLLLNVLALSRRSEHIHVAAAQHRSRIGVLSSRVRVNLGVEHNCFNVRAVLQDYF